MKRKPITYLITLLAMLLTLLVVAGGCKKGVEQSAREKEAQRQADIERIKNDPNMPPQAKEMALKMMEQGQKHAEARKESK